MVITDLSMPVMNGAELIAAMRKEPALDDVMVVVSTSAPERAPAGVPVLAKPFNIAELWDWIRRTCGRAASSSA
jgi:CheY-like chemotaxis protein